MFELLAIGTVACVAKKGWDYLTTPELTPLPPPTHRKWGVDDGNLGEKPDYKAPSVKRSSKTTKEKKEKDDGVSDFVTGAVVGATVGSLLSSDRSSRNDDAPSYTPPERSADYGGGGSDTSYGGDSGSSDSGGSTD